MRCCDTGQMFSCSTLTQGHEHTCTQFMQIQTHACIHTQVGHWLSLEINVGVIHSAGPDHIKMDGPPGGLCVCVHTGPHLPVFSPILRPVT